MKRNRGQGSIISRPGTKNLYIRYWTNGRQIQEAVGSDSLQDAEKLLQQRMGEDALGIRPAQDVKNLKYDDLRASYVAEHPIGEGGIRLGHIKHLDDFFMGVRITDINTDLLRSFIATVRGKKHLADPTVRRILVILRSMFNQAKRESKIRYQDVPYFPMPADSKPRKGFIMPDQFAKLHDALPENLRPLIKFVYFTGCRIGAAKQITWSMVSQDCSEIELPGEIMKTGEPLTLPLVGPLAEVANMLKKMFRNESAPVFSTRNLRLGWCGTCNALGLGKFDAKMRVYTGLTIHDLRRSAARNLIRAGVDRGTAMSITGHKTEHVFERYNIKNVDDRKEALIKVGQYATKQTKQAASG